MCIEDARVSRVCKDHCPIRCILTKRLDKSLDITGKSGCEHGFHWLRDLAVGLSQSVKNQKVKDSVTNLHSGVFMQTTHTNISRCERVFVRKSQLHFLSVR